MNKYLFFGLLWIASFPICNARQALPPLLISARGKRITNVKEWEKIRRPELIKLFSEQMFGITPKQKVQTFYKETWTKKDTLKGTEYKKIKISFSRKGIKREMNLSFFIPNLHKGQKVPAFLSYDTPGRQTLNEIIQAGYAIVTLNHNDLFPEGKNKYSESILPLFGYRNENDLNGTYWQTIGAWAWGLSRALDYLEKDPDIDAKKIIVIGHSRDGKAALWAGVQDKRFAVVISNESGCGGASILRHTAKEGETVKAITTHFPAWFCKNFSKYGDHVDQLPFDQHEYLALIAPRPLYIASAKSDPWSYPKGEYLSAYFAGEVYRLYGQKGLESPDMPAVNSPVMNRIGYHVRTGGHDMTDYDWKNFITFADKWLKNK